MKKLLLLIFALFSLNTFAQKLDSTALILIDIQDFYFPGGDLPLVEPEQAAGQAKKVLDYFRENHGLVVHVKHAHEPGGNIYKTILLNMLYLLACKHTCASKEEPALLMTWVISVQFWKMPAPPVI